MATMREHMNTIKEYDAHGSVVEDELLEMANLVKEQTGVSGIIFISTQTSSHGPRVKYFLKPGKDQPSFSVSISDDPQIIVSSLPSKVVKQAAPKVIAWEKINHRELMDFWNNGTSWTDPEVTAFKEGLRKV